VAAAKSDLPALEAPVPFNQRTPSRWPPLSYYAKVTLVVVAVLVGGGIGGAVGALVAPAGLRRGPGRRRVPPAAPATRP